jgi:hypothetical protein
MLAWIFSLMCFFAFGNSHEPVLLIASGLFAIAGNISMHK